MNREITQTGQHGTWAAYIVRALWRQPDGMQKQEALNAIRADCNRRKRGIPTTFSDTVQASFETHNSGSTEFSRRGTASSADLFYFAGEKGDGKWGLHSDRAKSWMMAKAFELDLPETFSNADPDGHSDENALATETSFVEGKGKLIWGIRYERNQKLRRRAIELHGLVCQSCGFDFEVAYGDVGRGYIEVHHLKPLSSLADEAEVDPATDMAVLCANCHSMVHRPHGPPMSVDEIKNIVRVASK